MQFKDILYPELPAWTLKKLKAEYPQKYENAMHVIDELINIIIVQSNAEEPMSEIKRAMVQSLDAGLTKLGQTRDGTLTMLMWHFTKGAYLPLTPDCFTRNEQALTLQMSQYMLSRN